jgi:hypothetical protein
MQKRIPGCGLFRHFGIFEGTEKLDLWIPLSEPSAFLGGTADDTYANVFQIIAHRQAIHYLYKSLEIWSVIKSADEAIAMPNRPPIERRRCDNPR